MGIELSKDELARLPDGQREELLRRLADGYILYQRHSSGLLEVKKGYEFRIIRHSGANYQI